MELAISTGIPPASWAGEDDATIATALAVLWEMSEAANRGR